MTVRNLKRLYHINRIPSDMYLRERLDRLSPSKLRGIFKAIIADLQRGKMLERFQYLGGYHILSVDGTGQYASKEVYCKNCCERKHRNGEKTYYHHAVGAVFVHPDEKVVIPLPPEPITKSDGQNKNDCEQNAGKRLLQDFRREHPHLKTVVVQDSLASNHPHLSLLDELNLKYITGVKPGSHPYLFDYFAASKANETVQVRGEVTHRFRYAKRIPLSDEHSDYLANVLEYWEERPNRDAIHMSWVTSLDITEKNVYEIMRAARARWRIENETFNTLKNRGYHFEHNYGHGKENLCSVMSSLMFLAFLIDQVKELCDKLYWQARRKKGPHYALFECIRALFDFLILDSWQCLYEKIIGLGTGPPLVETEV